MDIPDPCADRALPARDHPRSALARRWSKESCKTALHKATGGEACKSNGVSLRLLRDANYSMNLPGGFGRVDFNAGRTREPGAAEDLVFVRGRSARQVAVTGTAHRS